MKRFFFVVSAVVVALCSWALEVSNTAGSLEQAVPDVSITQLTITGAMDARDFKFIAGKLNSLESIDMSNVAIVAYQDDEKPLFLDLTTYEENTIPATAFMGKNLREVQLPATLKTIDVAAFAGCENLETLSLPASLEVIAPYAFTACNKLHAITLPQGLKQMGDGAFSRCATLEAATITPAGDFAIGKDAFQDCKSLSSVTIGQNVSRIMAGAFSGCTALANPVIESGSKLASMGEAAFAASGVESIALDQCVELKSIGMWAFANTSLKNISLPSSLESLGDGAFYYNLDMENIDLPSTLTSLSNYLLAGNNNIITEQPVKDGVASIGDYAFYNWDNTREFNFPQSVRYIGTKAMAGQTALELVTAKPTTVPELGDDVWAGVPQHYIPLKVDKAVKQDYKDAEQWKEFIIQDLPTGIDTSIADAETKVKAWFSGHMLNVSATSEIASIAIFDTRGVMLGAATPASMRAELNTANYYGNYYIVSVVLADGSRHNYKLLRK